MSDPNPGRLWPLAPLWRPGTRVHQVPDPATRTFIASARWAPVGFGVLLVGLTIRQRGYLDRVGWDPVRRNETQWPSILGLGPSGILFTLALLVLGALCVLLGLTLHRSTDLQVGRWKAAAVAWLGGLVMVLALPADRPGAVDASWHAQVHNAAYLALITSWLVVAVAFARIPPAWPAHARRRLPWMLAGFLAGVAATAVPAIGQLGRYVVIGALCLWFYQLAGDAWEGLEEAQQ